MNQINPLHIGALLLVVIAFLYFKLHSVELELQEAKESYKESEALAVNLSSLKNIYANAKKTKKELNKILSHPAFKKANFIVKQTKNAFVVQAKSVDLKTLNRFMGKILNAPYNISIFKVKQLSETKASLEMEIKW